MMTPEMRERVCAAMHPGYSHDDPKLLRTAFSACVCATTFFDREIAAEVERKAAEIQAEFDKTVAQSVERRVNEWKMKYAPFLALEPYGVPNADPIPPPAPAHQHEWLTSITTLRGTPSREVAVKWTCANCPESHTTWLMEPPR